MKTTMKLSIMLGLLAMIAFGQASVFDSTEVTKHYVAVKETTLSGAAEAVTIAQPATASGQVIWMDLATVYCSVACVVTVERGGTAASTTALTPTPMSAGLVAARAKAFHSSNAGSGAELGKYRIAAGGEKTISLRGVRLRNGGGATEQLTVSTDAITGVARIQIKWAEAQPY
jgi:hypothetical protein